MALANAILDLTVRAVAWAFLIVFAWFFAVRAARIVDELWDVARKAWKE